MSGIRGARRSHFRSVSVQKAIRFSGRLNCWMKEELMENKCLKFLLSLKAARVLTYDKQQHVACTDIWVRAAVAAVSVRDGDIHTQCELGCAPVYCLTCGEEHNRL